MMHANVVRCVGCQRHAPTNRCAIRGCRECCGRRGGIGRAQRNAVMEVISGVIIARHDNQSSGRVDGLLGRSGVIDGRVGTALDKGFAHSGRERVSLREIVELGLLFVDHATATTGCCREHINITVLTIKQHNRSGMVV